jgi:hypothetical protein
MLELHLAIVLTRLSVSRTATKAPFLVAVDYHEAPAVALDVVVLYVPELYNLISDPKELYNLVVIDQSVAWILPSVLEQMASFRGTPIDEPPIQLGTSNLYTPAD